MAGLRETFFGASYAPDPTATQVDDRAGLEQRYTDFAHELGNIADGTTMGAGEIATRRAAQQAMMQQRAMAASARGYGSVGAERHAARQMAEMGTNFAGQAQIAALQDAAQARQQQLAAFGQVDALRLAEMQARLAQEGYRAQYAANDTGLAPGLIQGLSGAAAAAIMASDERVKEDVQPESERLREVWDKAPAHSWRYDEDRGGEESSGVMAQDLEQSELGRRVVTEVGGVKHVRLDKAVSLLLASASDTNRRLRQIEERTDG